MSDTDLHSLQRKDLNQLISLAALLSAGGVTRAAEVLDVSQPTMSKALTRLRETFRDPLLVREGNSMHLTPFANDLAIKLQDIIDSLDALYHPEGPFDPQTVAGWLKIGGNDYVQATLGLPFVRRMRQVAPNLRIEIRNVGSLYPQQILEEGIVDLVVSGAFPFANLHYERTISDPFICVADASNTTIPDRLSLDAFLDLPQADVSPQGTGVLRRHFERSQRRFKEERDIVTVLSSFASLPDVLTGSNMVALMPARMLAMLPAGRVRKIDIDFHLPAYDVSIWWHPRTHTNPLMRWARTELIEMANVGVSATERATSQSVSPE
jgi:DNA-binding transcriptional LysR family regulator